MNRNDNSPSLGACSLVEVREEDGFIDVSLGPWLDLGFDLQLQLLYVLLFPLLLIWSKKVGSYDVEWGVLSLNKQVSTLHSSTETENK